MRSFVGEVRVDSTNEVSKFNNVFVFIFVSFVLIEKLIFLFCFHQKIEFLIFLCFRTLDEGLAEAISTVLWAAPRIQNDVQELKIISEILTTKYGKQYTEACREEAIHTISEKLKHKLGVQAPSKLLVEKYLIEIAKNYNVEYEPDPQVMAEGQDSLLIDIGGQNNLGSRGPQPAGFIGFPQAPPLPNQDLLSGVVFSIFEFQYKKDGNILMNIKVY